jgi:hypothetical protein
MRTVYLGRGGGGLKERDLLEDLGVDGGSILKLILGKWKGVG